MKHTYKTPEIKVILINASEMLATSVDEFNINKPNSDTGNIPGIEYVGDGDDGMNG